MKFVDAVQLSSKVDKSASRLWLLTSYESSIFKIFLQAALVEENAVQAYYVQSIDFDILFKVLEDHKKEEFKHDPAVLSLLWEDFDPALGWRGRESQNFSTQLEFNPSEELAELTLSWLQFRSKQGAKTIVLTPPISWIRPQTLSPKERIEPFKIKMQAWLQKLIHKIEEAGAIIIDEAQGSLDLKSYLESGNPFTLEGARDLSEKLKNILQPKEMIKAVIVDLDQTLWPGVLEDGSAVEKQQKGSLTNRPYHELGRWLSQIKNAGLFIACASKNDESQVKDLFPALSPCLQFDQFNVVKINWEAKSKNIGDICNKLNILTKNVLFIDDNPAEILEVRSAWPEIQTILAPKDIREWPVFLENIRWRCLKIGQLDEDKFRTIKRPEENAQKGAGHSPVSSHQYLKSLNQQLELRTETWLEPRTLELINKTNQFNLNGDKKTLSDLSKLMNEEKTWCYSANLTDRYGPFGTIGLIWGQTKNDSIKIDGLILSCRAFERHVEYGMFQVLIDQFNPSIIEFQFKDTGRNGQLIKFLNTLGIISQKDKIVDVTSLRENLNKKIQEADLKVILK